MRTRAAELLNDHFRVDMADHTDELMVWEACDTDPFQEVSLVPPVFVTQITEPSRPLDLTRVKLY